MKGSVNALLGAISLIATVSASSMFGAMFQALAKPAVSSPSGSDLTNFPHWHIAVVDRSSQSADFRQFHQQLWGAVHHRDARFMQSIINAQTMLEIDRTDIPISTLNLDNPEAPFWFQMEKAIAKGCAIETNSSIPRDSGTSVWLCSPVLRAFEAAGKNAPPGEDGTMYGNYVAIVGQDVNVRAEPGTSAPIIGRVSNEIVKFDRDRFESLPERMKQEMVSWNLNGWTPVILPNGRRGYVSNRYAYKPLERRAIFVKSGGNWQLRGFVAGD